MLRAYWSDIRSVYRILGKKVSVFFIAGILGGILLSIIETQLAVFLQLFLKALGIDIQVSAGKFNFLGENHDFNSLMLILVGIGMLRSLAQFIVAEAAHIALELVNARMRLVAIFDLLHNPGGEFVSAGATNGRFSEVFPKTATLFYYGANTLPQLVVAFFLGCMLLSLSPASTAIAAVGILVSALVITSANRIAKRLASQVPKEQNQLINGVERVSRNWMLIKILRIQDMEFRKLSQNIINYANHHLKAYTITNIASSIPNTVGILLLVIIIIVNVKWLHSNNATVIAFLYIFLRLVQTLATIMNQMGQIVVFLPQARESMRYFDQFSRSDIHVATTPARALMDFRKNHDKHPESQKEVKSARIENEALPPSIAIENMSFSYAKCGSEIFSRFNMKVKAGDHIGITGKSGCGKSTLLGVILGILKPQNGKVELNSIEADKYLASISDRIGFVGAEPLLIEGTIKENLDYGSKRIYLAEEYDQAIEKASMGEVISGLPGGLEHRIEENGGGLSAGQKQRLALARALLRNPLVMILDEFSSNLDGETEGKIVEAIAGMKGKTTAIVVSHRPEALKYVDSYLHLS